MKTIHYNIFQDVQAQNFFEFLISNSWQVKYDHIGQWIFLSKSHLLKHLMYTYPEFSNILQHWYLTYFQGHISSSWILIFSLVVTDIGNYHVCNNDNTSMLWLILSSCWYCIKQIAHSIKHFYITEYTLKNIDENIYELFSCCFILIFLPHLGALFLWFTWNQ